MLSGKILSKELENNISIEFIKHFDHNRLLRLMTLFDKSHLISHILDEGRCMACLQLSEISFQHYICDDRCGYFLHKSCGKLPKEVRSPFHTQHQLTRKLFTEKDHELLFCCACGEKLRSKRDSRMFFSCKRCNFQLDPECALMMPVKEIDEKPIQRSKEEAPQISFYLDLREGSELHTHPNHQHQLLQFNEMPKGKNFNCLMCEENCGNLPTYFCCECQFYLHKSCFERKLPQKIQHFYHPHTLILSPKQLDQNMHSLTLSASQCEACYIESSRGWYYSCKQCKYFDMDIDCTLLPGINSESGGEQIRHFLHGHPLSLSPHNKRYPDKCLLCGKGCRGHTTYICRFSSSYCKNIYFHKSCLVFPPHIFHPLHPYHRLMLTNLKFERESLGKCKACQEWPYEFPHHPWTYNTIIYSCEANCKFFLHAECGVMNPVLHPVVTYEGHDHLLQFIRDANIENNKLHCCACNSQICESYAFTCLYCDLNLHLHCGPLPYTIQHTDHNTHLLFLTNSPVQEELEGETDEFYCHVCEAERDPRLPVYYCSECYFIADFKCVLTQIISLLKGEYGDIELRNTLGQRGQLISANSAKEMWQNKFKEVKQTSTLSDILGSSRKDVKEELNNVSNAMKTFTIEEDEYSEDFLFSDKGYTQFMKSLDRGKWNPDPWKDPEEYVNIEDYMVPLRLAFILRQLLSIYGDISAKSMLSPMAKLYLYIDLCECLYSMTNTRVVDISKDMLLNWWTCLKMLKTAGFEVQFAFNHLKRVAHASFGLNVKKRVDEIDKDIFELHKVLQNLQNKIKELEKKREGIRFAESAKSNLIEECLREASILKHGKASAGLISIL